MECIFCKIVQKEMESDIVYEDNQFAVFPDIHPKAPVHLLIVPKKHIESIATLPEHDRDMAGSMILLAKKMAQEQGVDGYKLLFNVGRPGGQEIDHLHLHLLGYRSE